MRQIRQICLTIIFVFLLSSFAAKISFASDSNFSSSYDVTYKIDSSAVATVTQNIHLTNLTSEVFASEYVLRLSDTGIYNLHAADRKGAIEIFERPQKNFTEVRFKFNEHIVGIGKTLNWTLTYDTPKIAQKVGRIWEISIPPPQISPNTKSYTIGLYVPSNFGSSQYLKPKPNLGPNLWNALNSSPSGISAAYIVPGLEKSPYQLFDFKFKYHLQNTGFLNSVHQIALPPDTNYQKVFLNSLVPKPTNVTIDPDGNWLAAYSVPGTSILDITASGIVQVFNTPQDKIIIGENLNDYLVPKQFWETKDAAIEKKSQELKTPENIYNFVVNHLNYDKNRITQKKGRIGAAKVLIAPSSAICMEFTDLFIALSRSAGTAAREIDGYGFTLDQSRQPINIERDVLHAWPEYYNSSSGSAGGWRMIDPTWGKTTKKIDYFHSFDFDHIAFVIRGKNSTIPKPAGSYKITPLSVDLTISKSPDLTISTDFNGQITTLIPNVLSFEIKNVGPVFSPKTELIINSGLISDPPTLKIDPLPPFASQKYSVTLRSLSISQQGNDIIKLNLGTSQKEVPVTITPFYVKPIILIILGLIIIAFLSVTSKIARSILLQKRRR